MKMTHAAPAQVSDLLDCFILLMEKLRFEEYITLWLQNICGFTSTLQLAGSWFTQFGCIFTIVHYYGVLHCESGLEPSLVTVIGIVPRAGI